MRRGKLYCVIYLVSSLYVVGSQRLIHLNPLIRPLIPARMQQYTLTYRNGCSLNNVFCRYLNSPVLETASTFKITPIMDPLTLPTSVNGQLWNPSVLNENALLEIHKSNLSAQSQRTEYFKNLLLKPYLHQNAYQPAKLFLQNQSVGSVNTSYKIRFPMNNVNSTTTTTLPNKMFNIPVKPLNNFPIIRADKKQMTVHSQQTDDIKRLELRINKTLPPIKNVFQTRTLNSTNVSNRIESHIISLNSTTTAMPSEIIYNTQTRRMNNYSKLSEYKKKMVAGSHMDHNELLSPMTTLSNSAIPTIDNVSQTKITNTLSTSHRMGLSIKNVTPKSTIAMSGNMLNNYPISVQNYDPTQTEDEKKRTDHRISFLLTAYNSNALSPVKNISQSKALNILINNLNKTDSINLPHQTSFIYGKSTTARPGEVFNNSFVKTGIITNEFDKLAGTKIESQPSHNHKSLINDKTSTAEVVNTLVKHGNKTIVNHIAGTKIDSRPSVLFRTTTSHMQNTSNGSETVPSFNETTISIETSKGSNNVTTINQCTNTSSRTEDLLNKTQLSINPTKIDFVFGKFRKKLDQVERKFLLSVFNKLRAISPTNRKENGISFLQSGFFLFQLLLSLSIILDRSVTREVEDFLALNMSEDDKIDLLERTVSWLPQSSNVFKFRWSSRLVVQQAAGAALEAAAAAGRVPLQMARLAGNETAAQLTATLNNMVSSDSGGSMQDTFDEEEMEPGVCAAVLGTLYVRGAWRAAPTLLNDTLPFRDAPAAPSRTSRYFRLNDFMAYSYLHEWDAEAIEISYATPGLTLLILVPKEPSLQPLVQRVAATSLQDILDVMHTMRLAVTLPLYTLRMTLLLPNKLEDMGMPSLLTNASDCQPVKLSHAVQRLMFWAEAGRNAFKDDGNATPGMNSRSNSEGVPSCMNYDDRLNTPANLCTAFSDYFSLHSRLQELT